MARRSHGTGSLTIHRDSNGRETWYGRWRIGERRVNRRVGLKRKDGTTDGLMRTQAERELRRLMESDVRPEPLTNARMTVQRAGQPKAPG